MTMTMQTPCRALAMGVAMAAMALGCGGVEEQGSDEAELLSEIPRGSQFAARAAERATFAVEVVERDFEGLPGRPIGPNLIINPSFESQLDGAPIAWFADGTTAELSNISHSGSSSAKLTASTPTDIAWHQLIDFLIIQRRYLLCGWIKGHDVVRHEAETVGASIAAATNAGLFQADAGSGTFGWKKICVTFTAVTNFADVMCRLGGPQSPATGTMFCEDLSLHELSAEL